MARMTAKERLLAQEKQEREELAARERFTKEDAPMRMLKMMAQASQLLIPVFVKEHNGVLTTTFSHHTDTQKLDLTAEEWQFETVEETLRTLMRAQEEEDRMRELARETFDSLSPEQRHALGLTRRP